MGEPKAMVELASRPLVARVVATVGSAGLDPVVVAKPDSPLPKLDCRVLSEPSEPQHPLTGVITALGASAGRGVVVIACDMPLVPSKLLTWLAQLEEPVAVCEVNGRLEPLLGRYSPETREQLAESLAAGTSVREAVAALDPFVDPRGARRAVRRPGADLLQRQHPRGPRGRRGAARPHRSLYAALQSRLIGAGSIVTRAL